MPLVRTPTTLEPPTSPTSVTRRCGSSSFNSTNGRVDAVIPTTPPRSPTFSRLATGVAAAQAVLARVRGDAGVVPRPEEDERGSASHRERSRSRYGADTALHHVGPRAAAAGRRPVRLSRSGAGRAPPRVRDRA